MKYANVTDEILRSKLLSPEKRKKFDALLGRDIEDINNELLGGQAIDRLKITPDMRTAIPVGSPNLHKAKSITDLLKEYSGIYSVR